MAIPRVQSCCCGCTLETGTKIIAWLELIAVIGVLITSISSAVLLEDPSNFPGVEKSQIDLLYGIFVTVAVVSSIQLLIAILLIYGATTGKASFIKPWFYYSVIVILMSVVMLIVNCVVYANANMASSITSTIVTAILNICLKLYYMLVVYSFYLQLRENPVQYGA